MIALLNQWNGHFEIDGKIYENLDDVTELKDGDDFHIVLLPNRKGEDDEEDIF